PPGRRVTALLGYPQLRRPSSHTPPRRRSLSPSGYLYWSLISSFSILQQPWFRERFHSYNLPDVVGSASSLSDLEACSDPKGEEAIELTPAAGPTAVAVPGAARWRGRSRRRPG